jgi:hypothetical protein
MTNSDEIAQKIYETKLIKARARRLRKQAIKLQNTSARKMSMAEALKEVQNVSDDV